MNRTVLLLLSNIIKVQIPRQHEGQLGMDFFNETRQQSVNLFIHKKLWITLDIKFREKKE
jgi:hypothetical protein